MIVRVPQGFSANSINVYVATTFAGGDMKRAAHDYVLDLTVPLVGNLMGSGADADLLLASASVVRISVKTLI